MYHLSVYCTLLYARTAFFFLCCVFPQVSSSSSTLSLLFGKRSFSSGLVISGLSAAEGGNTTDTQSSSSVNIAMGPSHRSSSRATQVENKSTGRHSVVWRLNPPHAECGPLITTRPSVRLAVIYIQNIGNEFTVYFDKNCLVRIQFKGVFKVPMKWKLDPSCSPTFYGKQRSDSLTTLMWKLPIDHLWQGFWKAKQLNFDLEWLKRLGV